MNSTMTTKTSKSKRIRTMRGLKLVTNTIKNELEELLSGKYSTSSGIPSYTVSLEAASASNTMKVLIRGNEECADGRCEWMPSFVIRDVAEYLEKWSTCELVIWDVEPYGVARFLSNNGGQELYWVSKVGIEIMVYYIPSTL